MRKRCASAFSCIAMTLSHPRNLILTAKPHQDLDSLASRCYFRCENYPFAISIVIFTTSSKARHSRWQQSKERKLFWTTHNLRNRTNFHVGY